MKNLLPGQTLTFLFLAVAFLFAGCSSDNDSESEVSIGLSIPENVKLTASTETSLSFSWSAVEEAAGYASKLVDVERDEVIAEKENWVASVTFNNLEENKEYKFAVQAYNKSTTSDFCSYVIASTDAVPEPPVESIDFEFPEWENDGLVRAFPGAEGGGMYTAGGRGGKVYYVTTLEDTNKEGSLRYAIERSGARTIVFDVDGVIELKSKLEIKNGDLTIAGQTAPGDGICLKNYSLVVKANNVIIRYVRCRMGDEKGEEDDAMWGRYLKNVIIDHCSMSWSTDECSSFYANENFTMQWCVLSESLRRSTHAKGNHGYGAIWGGVNVSFHHNLLAHHDSRNPRFDGGDVYGTSGNPMTNDQRAVDFRNCVVYNFSNYPAYGGEGQNVNFTGNYYKWGPGSINGPDADTKGKKRTYIYFVQGVKENSDKVPTDYGCPSVYIGGNTNTNVLVGQGVVWNSDNWFAYDSKNQGATELTILSDPVPIQPGSMAARVTNHRAEVAYEQVLEYAGVSLKRDVVDLRAVNDTRTGTATFMAGSNGSLNGYIDSQSDVGGWPMYVQGDVKVDTDGDGIPDEWEEWTGLDKNSATDGNEKTLDPTGRYTNLEVYLHWLAKDITHGQVSGGDYIFQ